MVLGDGGAPVSRAVIVLPSIHVPTTMRCLTSLASEIIRPEALPMPPTFPQREPFVQTVNGEEWVDGRPKVRLMVIWNDPTHNLGVSRSWERGRAAKAERDEVITVLAKAGFTTVQIAAKTEVTAATVLAVMKRLGIRTARSRLV